MFQSRNIAPDLSLKIDLRRKVSFDFKEANDVFGRDGIRIVARQYLKNSPQSRRPHKGPRFRHFFYLCTALHEDFSAGHGPDSKTVFSYGKPQRFDEGPKPFLSFPDAFYIVVLLLRVSGGQKEKTFFNPIEFPDKIFFLSKKPKV